MKLREAASPSAMKSRNFRGLPYTQARAAVPTILQ